MTALSEALAAKRDQLIAAIGRLGACAVAFSGGVDSAVAAKAARLALDEQALAITGESPALAAGELRQASDLARLIGLRHIIVATQELDRPAYAANGPDRCYHCKTELYVQLKRVAAKHGIQVLINGANADDFRDYRPGMTAAAEHDVRSPLAECGLTKEEVRQLAGHWDLPVADKPATPCLSSRLAYGQEVTPERLRMIDQAEQFLRTLGFRELRVRYHGDDLARVEVPPGEMDALCEPLIRDAVIAELRELGFKFVTLDLAGFRSGSFQSLVPEEALTRFRMS
jgi:uncharacterized protein